MKYLEMLNRTADETAKSNNELVAEEANLTIQSEILDCKKKIASKASEIFELKQQKPLCPKAIIQGQCELAILDKKWKMYEELLKELF